MIELRPGTWRILIAGRRLGEITRHHLGRNRREFFEARAIDDVELGFHPSIAAAHAALIADDSEGRPRMPDNPKLKRPEGWRAFG